MELDSPHAHKSITAGYFYYLIHLQVMWVVHSQLQTTILMCSSNTAPLFCQKCASHQYLETVMSSTFWCFQEMFVLNASNGDLYTAHLPPHWFSVSVRYVVGTDDSTPCCLCYQTAEMLLALIYNTTSNNLVNAHLTLQKWQAHRLTNTYACEQSE